MPLRPIPAIAPAIQHTAQKALSPAAQTAYDTSTRYLGRSARNAVSGAATYLTWDYLLPFFIPLDPTPVGTFLKTIFTGYFGIRSLKHLFNSGAKYIDYRQLRA